MTDSTRSNSISNSSSSENIKLKKSKNIKDYAKQKTLKKIRKTTSSSSSDINKINNDNNIPQINIININNNVNNISITTTSSSSSIISKEINVKVIEDLTKTTNSSSSYKMCDSGSLSTTSPNSILTEEEKEEILLTNRKIEEEKKKKELDYKIDIPDDLSLINEDYINNIMTIKERNKWLKLFKKQEDINDNDYDDDFEDYKSEINKEWINEKDGRNNEINRIILLIEEYHENQRNIKLLNYIENIEIERNNWQYLGLAGEKIIKSEKLLLIISNYCKKIISLIGIEDLLYITKKISLFIMFIKYWMNLNSSSLLQKKVFLPHQYDELKSLMISYHQYFPINIISNINKSIEEKTEIHITLNKNIIQELSKFMSDYTKNSFIQSSGKSLNNDLNHYLDIKPILFKMKNKKNELKYRDLEIDIINSLINQNLFASMEEENNYKKYIFKISCDLRYNAASYYCQFKPIDLLGDDKNQSKLIINYFNYQNLFVDFIITSINKLDETKAYVLIKFWLDVAKQSLQPVLNDFLTPFCIGTAFNLSYLAPIMKNFKDSKINNNNEYITILNELKLLISPFSNYKNLKEKMNKEDVINELYIPYIGIYTKATYMTAQSSDLLDKDPEYNTQILEPISKAILECLRGQDKWRLDKYNEAVLNTDIIYEHIKKHKIQYLEK